MPQLPFSLRFVLAPFPLQSVKGRDRIIDAKG